MGNTLPKKTGKRVATGVRLFKSENKLRNKKFRVTNELNAGKTNKNDLHLINAYVNAHMMMK